MPAVSGLLAYSPVAAAGSPLSFMKLSTARMAMSTSSSGVRYLPRVSATLPGNRTIAKATAKKIAVVTRRHIWPESPKVDSRPSS